MPGGGELTDNAEISGFMSGDAIGEREPTLDIGLFIVIFMPAVIPDIPIDIPVLLDMLLSKESAKKNNNRFR